MSSTQFKLLKESWWQLGDIKKRDGRRLSTRLMLKLKLILTALIRSRTSFLKSSIKKSKSISARTIS